MFLNLNQKAVKVAKLEGGKQNLNISQIKEVLGCEDEILAQMSPAELLDHLGKKLRNGQKRLKQKSKSA